MRQLIVIMYDERMALLPREFMALRAVEEPMFRHASKQVTTRETRTARMGIFQPGVTIASHFEPGRPRSRANDQSCLDAVAVSLIQQDVIVRIIMVVRMLVAV